MDTVITLAIMIAVVVGTAVLIHAVVMYRHQITGFFRAIANPPYNNWVLLGLWIGVVVLFFLAVFMGGGEPFGLSLLREAAITHHSNPQTDFYNPPQSRALYSHGYQAPRLPDQQSSWVWWYLFLGCLALAIIFIPIAFHDEVGNAWNRAWERIGQRQRRTRLHRPAPVSHPLHAPPPTAATAGAATTQATFWNQLRRRLSEHLPADIVAEFINDFIGGAARAIFRR